MSNFVWSSKKSSDEIVTISNSSITLNKASSSFFETAFNVLLGLDSKEKKFAIKPISKEQALLGHIPQDTLNNITVKASYARICNKQFIEELSSLASLTFEDKNQVYKFKAAWDESIKALVIDLAEGVE